MKALIEKMVREEINAILSEHIETIKEIVASSLLPQLRAAIQAEIQHTLGNLLEQNPEHKKSDNRKPELRDPQSAIRNPQSEIGLYLYGIADGDHKISLGNIGLEANEVYTIPFGNLSAIVHNCTAEPYQSDDQDIVKAWVLTHQKVVDAAGEEFGTIIPMGFDTIICGKGDQDPKKNMQQWIEDDYDNLTLKMAKIRDKAEYGVQIFWETNTMAHQISKESVEINRLREEIKTKPKGIAYMFRQKLEELLKNEMANKADQCFQEFYEEIRDYADDLRVEKTKKTDDEGLQMLLNLSCLLPKDQSEKLGEALEKIDGRVGFSVRYTGPWPPYSFV